MFEVLPYLKKVRQKGKSKRESESKNQSPVYSM